MKLFRSRGMSAAGLLLAVAGLLGLGSCTPLSDDNTSAVQAFVSSINGGLPLNSDVRISSGGSSDVVDDQVTVTVRTVAKASGVTLSSLYTVVFNTARITFTRADGFNRPGVDVPFPLTEFVSLTVAPNSLATVTLTLVTHQMKLEPPLRNLWFQGGELEINATATVELFGEDLAGNTVTAVGSAVVFFADFADD